MQTEVALAYNVLQTCEGKDLEVQIFNLKTNIKMKNRFSIDCLTLAFASLLLCAVFSCQLPDSDRSYNFNKQVEAGQTWYQFDTLNPYKTHHIDTFYVIEVKGDYAKVVWNGDTTSCKKNVVRCCGAVLK
jgi:hypothetical protein